MEAKWRALLARWDEIASSRKAESEPHPDHVPIDQVTLQLNLITWGYTPLTWGYHGLPFQIDDSLRASIGPHRRKIVVIQ